MAFMQLESEFGVWYLVEGPNGTDVIPASVAGDCEQADIGATFTPENDPDFVNLLDDLRDYMENEPERVTSIEIRECWGARYSAPGYMDCTDWVLGETQEEAESEAREMYGDDEEDADDE